MSHPGLDADLAAALEVLQEFGPLQVLDVYPTTPRRPPDVSPAPAAGPEQPGLFDPDPESEPAPSTSTSTTDPLGHIPPSRRPREVLGHASAGRPAPPLPTPDTL
jgi:hypothetical protein